MSFATRVPAWLLALGLLLAPLSARGFEPQPEPATGRQAKAEVTARRFMVVAAHPLAAEAGHQVLAAGGNAIDAAVAVQFALNVVEPQSSGIGGGAFLLYRDKTGRLVTL